MPSLFLDAPARQALWKRVFEIVERYAVTLEAERVTPEQMDPQKIRALLAPLDFDVPLDPQAALDLAARGLQQEQLHVPHPRYFGLFNPAPTTMSIAADTLVAAFNPQLAAWAHSPFGVEVEEHLIRSFGERFGYARSEIDGTFTSCGSEANHTAMLCALTRSFPHFAARGLRALPSQPVLYASSEGHHSLPKAACMCGLGNEALRWVPVDDSLKMDLGALRAQIAQDRRAGLAPFLAVGTAGTTNAGVIDPLGEIAEVAAEEGLWFHVDAAWGGAAALVEELRPVLSGIERADSITFDAHKWLSVPVAAGLYLSRHPRLLSRTFHVSAVYVPKDGAESAVTNPLSHSITWSRRFTGLKVFLSLVVAGWEGYAKTIRDMAGLGELLRRELQKAGWTIRNQTPLPVVCFTDGTEPNGNQAGYLEAVRQQVVDSGKAWISTTRVGRDLPVLRACITNYRTRAEDIRILVDTLEWARQRVGANAATVEAPRRE